MGYSYSALESLTHGTFCASSGCEAGSADKGLFAGIETKGLGFGVVLRFAPSPVPFEVWGLADSVLLPGFCVYFRALERTVAVTRFCGKARLCPAVAVDVVFVGFIVAAAAAVV